MLWDEKWDAENGWKVEALLIVPNGNTAAGIKWCYGIIIRFQVTRPI